MKPTKVLIIDDSELIRGLLREILAGDPDIEVVGSAIDPYDAREKIKELKPDVITLDVEMPRMDGITFLSNLMRLRPMPVVMISTLTEKGANVTLQALELGAVDFVAKPKSAAKNLLPALGEEICSKVKQAAKANVAALDRNRRQISAVSQATTTINKVRNQKIRLIAIGASTGGTEAVKEVLANLPTDMPPVIVTQHMPPGFTQSYALRLDKQLPLAVEEFRESGQALLNGHVYIANGAQHLLVQRRGGTLYGYCDDSEPVNRHRPSVDAMFFSVAEHCGDRVAAALLTGMGSDGAKGMANIKAHGGITVAQDQATSVVWGMPKAAVDLGATDNVLPIHKIGKFLTDLCYRE